ncbi:MAG: ABC transporter substrate-binding protein, partial [Alphaproteobacteria bacterium]
MTRRAALRRAVAGLLATFALVVAAGGGAHADMVVLADQSGPVPNALIEPPALAESVAAGALPPVSARLPARPLVVGGRGRRKLGEYGGDWRMLIGRVKDVRMLVVYGYARLVCYGENFDFEPDILERVEIEDDRVFTLKLRPGHKWSDGQPFTSEDFRYYW